MCSPMHLWCCTSVRRSFLVISFLTSWGDQSLMPRKLTRVRVMKLHAARDMMCNVMVLVHRMVVRRVRCPS